MHVVEPGHTEAAKAALETSSVGKALRIMLAKTRGLASAFWVRFVAAWLPLYWQGCCLIRFPAFHDLTDKYSHAVWDAPTSWFATYVLRIAHPVMRIPIRGTDSEFDWTQDLLFVMLAALGAGLWTALRRNSAPGPRFRAWVALALRLVLGTQLALYGITKVIPAQFPPLSPSDFVARFGQYSMMSMYWRSVGAASPWYQVSLGLVEVLVGVLLVLPTLWVLGAALSVLVTVQLVLVNVYFDLPVKLHSTHLLTMALILFLPHFERIWNALVASRSVDPLPQRALTSRRSADRAVAVAAVIVFVLSTALAGVQAFAIYSIQGPRPATPPLMGAWRALARTSPIEYFIVNGYTIPARTSYVDSQHALVSVVLELGDGSIQMWDGMIIPAERRIALIKPPAPANAGSSDWPLQFHYEQPGASQLKISGAWSGRVQELTFDHVDLSKLPLSGGSAHWVNSEPQWSSSSTCRCDSATGIRNLPRCPANRCPLPPIRGEQTTPR